VAEPTLTPFPSPTPLPPYDPEADFAKYLNESNVGNSTLAHARLLYGQAELAKFVKKPEIQKQLMQRIYGLPVNLLSAKLLADCGEMALQKGDPDKAEMFYRELMASFPKSDLLEYAYCGMGEVFLARNKPQEALNWFNDALNKLEPEAKLAQITYGKGKALLALGKLDEAQKIFEEVAGNKDWRGEVTAQALLSLGDLYEKKGDVPGAIQYYQRVFVAYQRYPDLVITAYFKAADGFMQLNQPEKAAAHFREMLANPRLAQLPRAEEARKKLESLPAASPTGSPSPSPAP
jgi:tetratricopeptide (TPR) repeat protein